MPQKIDNLKSRLMDAFFPLNKEISWDIQSPSNKSRVNISKLKLPLFYSALLIGNTTIAADKQTLEEQYLSLFPNMAHYSCNFIYPKGNAGIHIEVSNDNDPYLSVLNSGVTQEGVPVFVKNRGMDLVDAMGTGNPMWGDVDIMQVKGSVARSLDSETVHEASAFYNAQLGEIVNNAYAGKIPYVDCVENWGDISSGLTHKPYKYDQQTQQYQIDDKVL